MSLCKQQPINPFATTYPWPAQPTRISPVDLHAKATNSGSLRQTPEADDKRARRAQQGGEHQQEAARTTAQHGGLLVNIVPARMGKERDQDIDSGPGTYSWQHGYGKSKANSIPLLGQRRKDNTSLQTQGAFAPDAVPMHRSD